MGRPGTGTTTHTGVGPSPATLPALPATAQPVTQRGASAPVARAVRQTIRQQAAQHVGLGAVVGVDPGAASPTCAELPAPHGLAAAAARVAVAQLPLQLASGPPVGRAVAALGGRAATRHAITSRRGAAHLQRVLDSDGLGLPASVVGVSHARLPDQARRCESPGRKGPGWGHTCRPARTVTAGHRPDQPGVAGAPPTAPATCGLGYSLTGIRRCRYSSAGASPWTTGSSSSGRDGFSPNWISTSSVVAAVSASRR